MSINYFIIGNWEEAQKRFFVCHGIFGSARNWRSFIYRLHKSRPDCCFIVVDLRCHGESHQQKPPHNLERCATDLIDLETHLGCVDGIIGHSFGGKVALCYATLTDYKRIWTLDTPPGSSSAAQKGEAHLVLQSLKTVPLPVKRRKDVAQYLLNNGFSSSIAQWMTTNVRPSTGGYIWRFDLTGIEQLLDDYFRRDYWGLLKNPPRKSHINLVRAEKSDRWTSEQIAQLEQLHKTQVHLLPDAGHWLHVDNPNGLMKMLVNHL